MFVLEHVPVLRLDVAPLLLPHRISHNVEVSGINPCVKSARVGSF